MKQAILITAYKNFLQLKGLVDLFDEDFSIYIHIDKKSKVSETEKQKLAGQNVKLITQNYSVNWGGLNHLKAYLLLCAHALEDKSNTYFHLITGQDYPVKSIGYFKQRFSSSEKGLPNYLEFFQMPAECWADTNGGMDRLELYNFYDLINIKRHGNWIYRFIKLQKKLNIRRSFPKDFPRLYGGSTYWSLNRDTLQYVLDFTDSNPRFFDRFKFTACAEETYFQTIILNSPYKDNVVNDNLRYIDWGNGTDASPIFLDETHFDAIIQSDNLFIRKVGENSTELINRLEKEIHQVSSPQVVAN